MRRIKHIFPYLCFFASFLMVSLWAGNAWSIPVFSRKYNLTCSTCHTAWPMLNAFGRRFKENGYRITREQELSEETHVKAEGMSLYKYTPLGVRVKGYLLDKKKGGETKIRPAHEFELMVAANVFDIVSAIAEVEGEDEDEWAMEMEFGIIGVHPVPEFNVVAGYGPVFFEDPYQTLADGGRRMTRAHKVLADLGYATGQRLRKSTPLITAYGRLGGRVFYSGGVTTGTGDPEGEDEKDFHGRLAIDLTDHIMIGGFFLAGEKTVSEELEETLDFSRFGFDFQVEYLNFSLFGAYMRTSDDVLVGGPSEKNDIFYAQALYIYRKDKRPLVVPIVRIENYSINDGEDHFTDGIFNLTVYPVENVNLSFEFWTNLSTPDGVETQNRITFLVNVVF